MRAGTLVSSEPARVVVPIASDSRPGVTYRVTVWPDDERITCDCPGYTYRSHCKHADRVRRLDLDPIPPQLVAVLHRVMERQRARRAAELAAQMAARHGGRRAWEEHCRREERYRQVTGPDWAYYARRELRGAREERR